MEKINKNNLDEWLFEYFEGNLSKEDSEKLFFEIGNNPAYQAEFKFWKMSYLTENSPVFYPLANAIKKRYFWENKWFYYVLSAAVGTAIIYFLQERPLEIVNKSTGKVGVKSQIKTPVGKEDFFAKERVQLKSESFNTNVKKNPEQKDSYSISQPDTLVLSEVSQTKDSSTAEVILAPDAKEVATNSENKLLQNNIDTKSKKTIKKKTGTHLKLSEKITEMNSNF
jgi:hypothetical protein